MTQASTIRAWVGAIACLAAALGFAASGFAQQENQNQDDSQQFSDQTDQDRGSRDQGQQSQQNQQQRQRDQQYQGQSDQSQWDQDRSNQQGQQQSNWPQPDRDGFGRQGTQYQYEDERQTTRSGGTANEQDAGLGVNIISDRGPGVIVTRVFRGTPADQMGIREGDRITQLNGQDVRSVNQFISSIRNMNPGDEVELEVLRNRDERTVRGELESRQEALLLTGRQQSGQQWQQGDQSWQTGYQESGTYGGFQQQGRTMRGDYNNRLNSIEQQVSRLSRELEQIRFALQDLRQSGGSQQYDRSRESQATYDEYQGGQRFGTRPQSEQWDGRSSLRQSDTYPDSGQQGRFEGSQGNYRSEARDAAEGGREGPAGITGGRRTRPDSDLDRLER